MDNLSFFLLSLDNEQEILPVMTRFPKFPPEIRNMVWTFAAMEPEVFTVKIRRLVKESPSKTKQKKNLTARTQFHFKYEATSGPINLHGYNVPHSSLRSATNESRAAYKKFRSHEIQLLGYGPGNKVFFNPSVDVLHFDDFSSLFSHHLRQRLRRPLPFLSGLDKAEKISFDPTPDRDRIEDLSEEVMEDFKMRISRIEMGWIENGTEYKKDFGWRLAKLVEENKLMGEMRPRAIRNSGALGRVNGGYISVEAKILRLPLTAEDFT